MTSEAIPFARAPGIRPGVPDEVADALAHRLRRARVDTRAPSIAAAVLVDGQLAWGAGVGSVDGRRGPVPTLDTPYRIGSITKTFVAAMVLQLRDEGRLALADPLGRHLDVPADLVDLRIVDLLGHASGLRAETSPPWWERSHPRSWSDLLADLEDPVEGRPAPAGVLHYSNPGFALLGRLVSELDARPWGHSLRARVVDPAGMVATTEDEPPDAAVPLAVHPGRDDLLVEPAGHQGAMAPAGQLWSCVADLVRWGRAVAGWEADVLDPGLAIEMGRPRLVAELEPTMAFGLGLQVFGRGGRTLVGHGGSVPGFVANLVVDRAGGTGAVTLTNSTTGCGGDLAKELMDLLVPLAADPAADPSPGTIAPEAAARRRPPRQPVAEPPTEVDPPTLARDDSRGDLVGRWYWGPRAVSILPVGQTRLRIDFGLPTRRSDACPVGPDRWVGRGNYFDGEPIIVVRAADATVRHVEVASMVLTRDPYAPADVVPGGIGDGWVNWNIRSTLGVGPG